MNPVRSKKSEIPADLSKTSRTSDEINKEEVLKLAKLARIKLSDTEAEVLSNEFEPILNYVGEVRRISSSDTQMSPENFLVRNIMRADGEGHESGMYTEKILSEAPAREGNYFKVKKIL